MAQQRVRRDLADVVSGGVLMFGCRVEATPVDSHVQQLHVVIVPDFGAHGGQRFEFEVAPTDAFPFAAPRVRCIKAEASHPNLDPSTGRVYLALLHEWRPIFSLGSIVAALQLLFHLDRAEELLDLYQLAPPSGLAATSLGYRESRRVSLDANRHCCKLQRTLPAARPNSLATPSPQQQQQQQRQQQQQQQQQPQGPPPRGKRKRSAADCLGEQEEGNKEKEKAALTWTVAPTSCTIQARSSNASVIINQDALMVD
jgi:ubiquitin-protein ligase